MMKKFLSSINFILCLIVFSLFASASALADDHGDEDNQPAVEGEGFKCENGVCNQPPRLTLKKPEFKECSKKFSCTAKYGIVTHGISCSYENEVNEGGSGSLGGNRSENYCKRYLGITTDVQPKRHPKDTFSQCYTKRRCTKKGGTSVITECCYFDHRTVNLSPTKPKPYCITDSQGQGMSPAENSEDQCRAFVSNEKRLEEQANTLFGKHNKLKADNAKLEEKNDRLAEQYAGLKKKYNDLAEKCFNGIVDDNNCPEPAECPPCSYSSSSGGSDVIIDGSSGNDVGGEGNADGAGGASGIQ